MSTIVVETSELDARAAGSDIAGKIRAWSKDTPPGAVILFASPAYDYGALLAAVQEGCRPRALVGCSSSGEFTTQGPSHGSVCGIALSSDSMHFRSALGRNLSESRKAAAQYLADAFEGDVPGPWRSRVVLMFSDALSGDTENLIEHFTAATAGRYQIVGGGAGDDARFQTTHVFHGTEAVSDGIVGLEILSTHAIGIGLSHGWEPATPPIRVTAASGSRVEGLNGMLAADVLEEHARATGQAFDRKDPLPFFLHNVLGIELTGQFKLRVPLKVEADGAVVCAAEIPVGSTIRIMRSSIQAAADAASVAARRAVVGLEGRSPGAALFFDCAATRLRMGREFGLAVTEVSRHMEGAACVGCNTYGQIARVTGQFSGFHNCTAVVCVFPS